MRYGLPVLLAATFALCACNPAPASTSASAAQSRAAYETPSTGSMIGGNDDQALSNGFNDPGMGNRNQTAGGH